MKIFSAKKAICLLTVMSCFSFGLHAESIEETGTLLSERKQVIIPIAANTA